MSLTQKEVDFFSDSRRATDVLVNDDEVLGLSVFRPAARKPMYVVRYASNGELVQETIGKTTKISLKKARKIARKILDGRLALPLDRITRRQKKVKQQKKAQLPAGEIAAIQTAPAPAPYFSDGKGPRRMLFYPDLKEKRGIKYTRRHLSRLESDGKFPKRVKLGENCVAWVESEIDEYLEAIIAKRALV